MSDKDGVVDETRSVLDGSISFVVGQVGRKLIGLVTTVLLARLLTVEDFGVLTFGLTVVGVAAVFGRLGTSQSLLKLLPKYADDTRKQRRTFTVAVGTVLFGIVLFGTVLAASADLINDASIGAEQFPALLRVLVFVMAANVLFEVVIHAFGGLQRIRYKMIVKDGIKTLFRSASIVLALYYGASILGIAATLAVGLGVGVALSVFLLVRVVKMWPTASVTADDAREFLGFSLPLTLQDGGSVLYKQVDLLMIGVLLSSPQVSAFKIATTITIYLGFPLRAINQMFVPLSSRMHESDDSEELDRLFGTVTRWSITLTLPVAAAVVIYRQDLLSVFGQGYVNSSALVLVLVVQYVVLNATGPSGQLLVMTNNHYYQVVNQWVFGVLNVILNYLLIVQMGVLGAALATVTTTTLANITRAVEVWYLEGMSPIDSTFLKPVIAVIPAIGVMYAISYWHHQFAFIVLGTIVGGVTYVASLVVFGIEEEDQRLLTELRS